MEASDDLPRRKLAPDDRRAEFIALYDDHVADVYKYIHRRCGDRAMAEDVTQDAFLTAVRTVEDPASINVGWLLRVAHNRLMDLFRRQSRQEAKLRLVGSSEPNQVDRSAQVAEQMRIRAALQRLSPDQRVVLSLHYMDGLTVAEIAEQLNRSQKSVEGLVTRARRALKRHLEVSDD